MKNQFGKVVLITFTSLAIAIGFGQGCAKSNKASSSDSVDATSDSGGSVPEYQIDPNSPTLSVAYNKQILDHMVSCSGVGVASDETFITWTAKRGAVSIDGTILTITSPMLMAVATISGDVCRDLIKIEKITPRIFKNVDWSSTTLPANAVLDDSIRGLALSCWQRQEGVDEHQVIIDAIQSEFGAGGISTSDAYLFLCTAMLSSLDTLAL